MTTCSCDGYSVVVKGSLLFRIVGGHQHVSCPSPHRPEKADGVLLSVEIKSRTDVRRCATRET